MTAPVRRINTPEPAAIVGVIEAALAFAVSGHWLHFSPTQIGLIMAAVSAALGVVVAVRTHQATLGVVVGLINAAAALGIGFNLHLSAQFTGALIALVTAVAALVNRSQATPKGAPVLARDDALAV